MTKATYSNRSALLYDGVQTAPVWALARAGGDKVANAELRRLGAVAHYAIDELGATGRPRLQDSNEIASDKLLVEGGDLLVSRLNPRRGHVFEVGVHDVPAVASTEFAVLRPGASGDPRFVKYAVSADFSRQHLDSHVRSSTRSHGRIEFGYLWNQHLPSPPVDQQRRIADYLETETARIDRLLTRNADLGRLVRARHERFVVAAVTGELSPGTMIPVNGVDWLRTVSSGHAVGPYAMYAQTGSGHTPSRSVPEYWVDCDIDWVTTGDVKRLRSGFVEYLEEAAERISQLGMANSAARLHPAGTVFLSRTASVGFAGVMAVPMATSQDFFTWTPDARLQSVYLLWALRAMRYSGHFDRLMYGSTHKTIYVPDLMTLRGPIPPIEEQQRIVGAIREQRDETIALLEGLDRANRLLAERRQALIAAVVTGELEV